ncbi:MAG: 2'-5' RNA ligase family protein [Acidobacteria bacterium]|nr:2'-5' RNA ligase family protein [Acidobacteriota bacterium]
MARSRYALVAYIHHPVGNFVENLRRELHPVLPHMPAHLTILPPRELSGPEQAALEFLEEACSRVEPFEVEIGDVGTFLPTTATVFLQVKRAAYRMRELHDQLCVEALNCPEAWPYVPHMTILKTDVDQQAIDAAAVARERWAEFTGPRTIRFDELMFVRETDGVWEDVGRIPLGRSLLSARP